MTFITQAQAHTTSRTNRDFHLAKIKCRIFSSKETRYILWSFKHKSFYNMLCFNLIQIHIIFIIFFIQNFPFLFHNLLLFSSLLVHHCHQLSNPIISRFLLITILCMFTVFLLSPLKLLTTTK